MYELPQRSPKLTIHSHVEDKPKTRQQRGYDKSHYKLRDLIFAEQCYICEYCRFDVCEHLHHIDHDTFNQDRSNLVGLCQRCHIRVHQRTNGM